MAIAGANDQEGFFPSFNLTSTESANTINGGEGADHRITSPPQPEAYKFNVFFEFVVPGVFLNIIGLLGLLGNLMSIVILSRPQMKSSVNCILIGLASFDLVLIVTSVLMFGFPAVYSYNHNPVFEKYFYHVFPYITPVVYPVGMIAQTGSVYLTLAVTLERYVAVCLPLRARALCTYGRARRLVCLVGVFALLYNLPRFMEVTWKTEYYPDMGRNVTNVVTTELRSDPHYISVYITWMYLVVMYIFPFVCLAAFNLLIYHQVRRANSERTSLTRLQQKEISLATMLMVVVFVFFVSNVLALVVNILEVMSITVTGLNNVSNTLVTFNSSVNFIIYCIFGDKFKRIFCKLFCCSFVSKLLGQQNAFVQRYPATATHAAAATINQRRGQDPAGGSSLANRLRNSAMTARGPDVSNDGISHAALSAPNSATAAPAPAGGLLEDQGLISCGGGAPLSGLGSRIKNGRSCLHKNKHRAASSRSNRADRGRGRRNSDLGVALGPAEGHSGPAIEMRRLRAARPAAKASENNDLWSSHRCAARSRDEPENASSGKGAFTSASAFPGADSNHEAAEDKAVNVEVDTFRKGAFANLFRRHSTKTRLRVPKDHQFAVDPAKRRLLSSAANCTGSVPTAAAPSSNGFSLHPLGGSGKAKGEGQQPLKTVCSPDLIEMIDFGRLDCTSSASLPQTGFVSDDPWAASVGQASA